MPAWICIHFCSFSFCFPMTNRLEISQWNDTRDRCWNWNTSGKKKIDVIHNFTFFSSCFSLFCWNDTLHRNSFKSKEIKIEIFDCLNCVSPVFPQKGMRMEIILCVNNSNILIQPKTHSSPKFQFLTIWEVILIEYEMTKIKTESEGIFKFVFKKFEIPYNSHK